jgi:glutaminyl-peptide cyclotransferase
MTKRSIALYLGTIGLLLILVSGWYFVALLPKPEAAPTPTGSSTPETFLSPTPVHSSATLQPPFDGQRAYADVQTQVAFGPRIPGTDGHTQAVEWMRGELARAGWQVEIQESEALGNPVRNIVARRSVENPEIILGAHYDTRIYADQDPDPENVLQPVPGANDGASGVAVLLELARTLPADAPNVWLVFFDAEDNGRIAGWDWILGSREFVKNNPVQPRAVVIVDMIGDADLNIYKERNSNPDLTDEIWEVVAQLGYEAVFIPEYKYAILDDHTPFLEAGIPAVDIIDFDYPYWHTIADTPDKVSADSLQAVGHTLWTWITQPGGN